MTETVNAGQQESTCRKAWGSRFHPSQCKGGMGEWKGAKEMEVWVQALSVNYSVEHLPSRYMALDLIPVNFRSNSWEPFMMAHTYNPKTSGGCRVYRISVFCSFWWVLVFLGLYTLPLFLKPAAYHCLSPSLLPTASIKCLLSSIIVQSSLSPFN